jgi:hypothetical protein
MAIHEDYSKDALPPGAKDGLPPGQQHLKDANAEMRDTAARQARQQPSLFTRLDQQNIINQCLRSPMQNMAEARALDASLQRFTQLVEAAAGLGMVTP